MGAGDTKTGGSGGKLIMRAAKDWAGIEDAFLAVAW